MIFVHKGLFVAEILSFILYFSRFRLFFLLLLFRKIPNKYLSAREDQTFLSGQIFFMMLVGIQATTTPKIHTVQTMARRSVGITETG